MSLRLTLLVFIHCPTVRADMNNIICIQIVNSAMSEYATMEMDLCWKYKFTKIKLFIWYSNISELFN